MSPQKHQDAQDPYDKRLEEIQEKIKSGGLRGTKSNPLNHHWHTGSIKDDLDSGYAFMKQDDYQIQTDLSFLRFWPVILIVLASVVGIVVLWFYFQ